MTRQWTMRSRLAAVILLCMALGAAVHARQRADNADLRDLLRERYDLLSLQDGVGLVPRARDAGIRIIEVRNGAVSVDGQALTGGELRARLGADADLILRITYLNAADQRQLAASGQADPPRVPELPGAGPAIVAPPATPEVPRPGRPDVPRSTQRGQEIVRIGNNVTVARGEVVDGEVVVVFGNATIDGEVNGELTVVMGNADLGPEAIIRDDVTVVGGTLNRAPGAVIEGRVENVAIGSGPWRGAAGFPGMLGATILGRVGSLAGTLFRVAFVALLALVVVAFGRPWIEQIADRASADPLRSGLAGFLAQLLFFPVLLMTIIVLAVSIVGIPLLLLLPFAIVLVLIVLLVGFTGVAYQVGRLLNGRFGWTERGPYATVLIGVLAIALVTLLARSAAVIGGSFLTFPLSAMGYMVEYAAWTLGFGAAILAWWRGRHVGGAVAVP